MTDCPECHHSINVHTDFYCLHANCLCNTPKRTAFFMARCKVVEHQLAIALEALKYISENDGNIHARNALDDIQTVKESHDGVFSS